MPKTSSIHVRVDPKVKLDVEKILNTLGMSTGEAINIYLKQIILNSGIPFEIKTPQFSQEMMEAIEEVEEMEKNPQNYKAYDSIEKFMEDLHSEI